MTQQLYYILKQFLGTEQVAEIRELKDGLINKTYFIQTLDNKKYILQQINHKVFKNVPQLMENLTLIIAHLDKKIEQLQLSDTIKTFHYYPVQNTTEYFFKHSDNTYWRLSDYIENKSINGILPTANLAIETGRLFGLFIKLLKDINLSKIKDTIQGFHKTNLYYDTFEKALKTDSANRLKNSQDIAEKIQKNAYFVQQYLDLVQSNSIPKRLAHNDAKMPNILFDKNYKAISVIDLDTCMPGYMMVDFADSIRTLCNTGLEDDKDLDNVSFDINLFKSYTKGFLSATKDFISQEEKDNLAFFALLITYEQAIRFYADYLNGDIYYQTDYPEHNLQRTKTQIKLIDDMLAHYDEMKKIVD